VQFDVNAQVVAVQLEFVTRAKTSVFIEGSGQGGDGAVERKLPVVILRRFGLVINAGEIVQRCLLKRAAGRSARLQG
jgi:hypothetical protein